MSEWIESFSMLITEDRGWSWSVIGIMYLAISLIIRNAFMRPIEKQTRELKRRWFTEVRDHYSKHSLAGWILYLASFGLVLFLWSRPQILPLDLTRTIILCVAGSFYFLSVLMHVQALGLAVSEVLRRMESKL